MIQWLRLLAALTEYGIGFLEHIVQLRTAVPILGNHAYKVYEEIFRQNTYMYKILTNLISRKTSIYVT